MTKESGYQQNLTAEEAHQRLIEGNRRFVAGQMLNAHQAADWRAHLSSGQHPFATVLACSDSRVPPELVFDQGFGDIFIIRVAGNVLDSDVLGSISYALIHLKTPLVVIMGHERCGAVTAALEVHDGADHEMRYIEGILDRIMPAIKQIDSRLPKEERLAAAVAENVHFVTNRLAEVIKSHKTLRSLPVELKKAVYDLDTGVVNFLDE
ncbi:MAG: Carbonic anhydrase [Planctomycetota bacterium]